MENKVFYTHERIRNRKTQYTDIHSHNFHELYFLINGNPKYLVGDAIFPVDEYDFVFIPKGTLHKTDNLSYNSCERILLFIEDSLIDQENRFIIEKLHETPIIKISSNKISEILNILKCIEKESEKEDCYSNTIINYYTVVLLSLICRYNISYKNFQNDKEDSNHLIHEIASYISKNFDQDLSLDTLSDYFHINKNYLCRKFKGVYGINMGDYIKTVRITNAEKLLNESTLSVTEISDKCGFNDPNYFSNIFKKVKGITPFQYRKLNDNK